ncbi:MAG: hypothetical protein CEN87_742 [Parcubacteria group bacterium Licking1014_1]|nr:MAG: hypothetical protein CEN87_742 [Parcubacteria group bacterium Licking1014_1]
MVKHLQHPSQQLMLACFPKNGVYHNGPRAVQEDIFVFVAENGSSIIEAGTGVGKTAAEYAILRACQKLGYQHCFLITPNKTILTQIVNEGFEGVKVALGRNEHPCLYYDEPHKADEIPCSMLKNCPHRVDQTTGKTHEEGAIPCPYLQQKFEVMQGGVVVCTMAFYLFTHLFGKDSDGHNALVIDEAHRISDVVRNCLSYEITDFHLEKCIELLQMIEASETETLKKFLFSLKRIAKNKAKKEGVLLDPQEIQRLIAILEEIDVNDLLEKIERAVRERLIDPEKDRETLKHLEVLTRDLRRYIRSFEFSLETDQRKPLNYTCAYYTQEREGKSKIQHRLVVKCYYVAPLIRKILPDFYCAFSATIGKPDNFGFETGIRGPFLSLDSGFPVDHTRVYLPTDTPNLAVNARNKRDLTQVLRKIAKACKRLSEKGHRSLAVTISNAEREKFLMLCMEEEVDAISYGNGLTAKEAAQEFKNGKGDVLVGTAANYSEGVDLPKQIAPVIFFLRPGYPNPKDPGTIFEERRWGGQRWVLWNYRIMNQALQVRGRNIRRQSDLGVTIFISQQFRRVLFASLPEWLEKAYRNSLTLDEVLADAEKLLGG